MEQVLTPRKKIALAMIVKDDTEVDDLRRALNSVAKWVDGIFITGTKDPQKKIKKLCKEYGAKWSFFPWVKDFSKARNFNFSRVPKEYEWILWIDADDIVVGGENFQDAISKSEAANVKQIFARYLYQVEADEQGNIKQILIEHLRERLVRNDDSSEWIAPIHETLIEKYPVGKTDYTGFYIVHLSQYDDMLDAMWRNIEILEDEVLRNPNDPRPIYYLAKAYFDTKDPMLLYEPAGEGIGSITLELMRDYIRKSGWAEERAQAWEYISMIHREMGEYKKSIYALLEAINEEPKFPSIYIQLALCYVIMKDWEKALHWVKVAKEVEIPQTTLVINPRDYKSMILEALFHIYFNTGKLEECQKVAHALLGMLPTEINQGRVREVDDIKHRNDIAHYTIKLANHLHQTKQFDRLKAVVNAIPQEIANEPILVNLRNELLPPRTHEDNEITIYCGPGFEQWSPKSVAKGIGGSEEAVINMSRELAKLGWKVTVYADPQDDQGEYEGVSYLPYYHINWKDNFNILVSWRQVGLFDLDVHAKKTYLWNHDIQRDIDYTPERVKKIDKVMFLSKWHRQNVPSLPEEKVFYTSNGINV
jgi:tetratricopeptide (TPR) repeat protein